MLITTTVRCFGGTAAAASTAAATEMNNNRITLFGWGRRVLGRRPVRQRVRRHAHPAGDLHGVLCVGWKRHFDEISRPTLGRLFGLRDVQALVFLLQRRAGPLRPQRLEPEIARLRI